MYVKFVYQGHRVKFNVTGARKCVRVCCSWVVCTGMKDYRVLIIVFSARRSYASAVLGVVTLSVCLSICPSVTRMPCNKTKHCNVGILIPRERVGLITLVFWHQQRLVGDTTFRLKIALKVTDTIRKTPSSTDYRL